MGRVLSSFFAAIIGGLVVLAGMSIHNGAINETTAARVASLEIALSPSQQTGPRPDLAAPVADTIAAFRAVGLEVGEVQQITPDSPCRYADGDFAGAAQFTVGQSRQGFCVFYLPDATRRDTAWNALIKVRASYPPRITIRGPILLVYIGSSQDTAARYEAVLARLDPN